MTIRHFFGFAIGQNFRARAAAFEVAAQVHIKRAGGDDFVRAENFTRIFPVPQRAEIREQLQLDSILHEQRIQLLAAGLVIRHHGERGPATFVGPQIHAVNPALQRQLVAIA